MRYFNRGIISPSGMFNRNQISTVLRKDTSYRQVIERVDFKGCVFC